MATTVHTGQHAAGGIRDGARHRGFLREGQPGSASMAPRKINRLTTLEYMGPPPERAHTPRPHRMGDRRGEKCKREANAKKPVCVSAF